MCIATRGGANSGGVPTNLGHGFTASIPFAQVINPVTGGNWEGGGVRPDVPVSADQALAKAVRCAQRWLSGNH